MPTLRELLPEIEAYARRTGAGFDYNHDFEHHVRLVARDAQVIATEEHADVEVCRAAALLHEIGLVGGREGHDERSAVMAEVFLRKSGASDEDVRTIVRVIREHNDIEHMTEASLEEKCVHDANELHTLGPNGFLRVFSDMISVLDHLSRHEAMDRWPSYQRRHRDRLQTKAARRMADQDSALMEEFYQRYRAYEER